MKQPKAKVSSLRLFPRAPFKPKGTGGKDYSKVQDDPAKFGNFGFDVNLLGAFQPPLPGQRRIKGK